MGNYNPGAGLVTMCTGKRPANNKKNKGAGPGAVADSPYVLVVMVDRGKDFDDIYKSRDLFVTLEVDQLDDSKTRSHTRRIGSSSDSISWNQCFTFGVETKPESVRIVCYAMIENNVLRNSSNNDSDDDDDVPEAHELIGSTRVYVEKYFDKAKATSTGQRIDPKWFAFYDEDHIEVGQVFLHIACKANDDGDKKAANSSHYSYTHTDNDASSSPKNTNTNTDGKNSQGQVRVNISDSAFALPYQEDRDDDNNNDHNNNDNHNEPDGQDDDQNSAANNAGFIGVAAIKKALRSYKFENKTSGIVSGNLSLFQEWADNGEWEMFGHTKSQYDPWCFPVASSTTQHGNKFKLTSKDVTDLQSDESYMKDYRQAVSFVLKSWGWDMKQNQVVQDMSSGMGWKMWEKTLRNLGHSLKLFNCREEFNSVRNFTKHLQMTSQRLSEQTLSLYKDPI